MIIDRGTQSSELWYEPGPGDSPEGRTGQWIVQSLRFYKYISPCLDHIDLQALFLIGRLHTSPCLTFIFKLFS